MKHHTFKKHFGQNFLKSEKFINSLVSSLNISDSDFVLEIGPGDGAVTQKLLDTGARVVCVEIDTDLIEYLPTVFGDYKNFSIIHENILDLRLENVFQEYIETSKQNGTNIEIKIIGSLPYNISKQIIRKITSWNIMYGNSDYKIKEASFIVQDEVAKNYVIKPPKANPVGMVTRLFAEEKKLESIPASQFYPKPKVDGGILHFKIKEQSEFSFEQLQQIEKVIKIGFVSPRKTLYNNLKNSNKFSKESIEKAFNEGDYSLKLRAHDMELEDWIKIYNTLGE